MKLKLLFFFLPGKDRKPWHIPCDLQIRWSGNFSTLRRLLLSFSLSFSLPPSVSLHSPSCRFSFYAFHTSFPADCSKDIGGSFLLEADAHRRKVYASAALYRAAYKWWITNIDPSREGAKEEERPARRKGSLGNYSRHAARKKRIYEWDVPSHWCRCGRLVPALISSKFNWV